MPLLIIGAAHVFQLQDAVRSFIERERPGVVALELDPQRYQGLQQRAAGTFDAAKAQEGAPRIYRRLARFQEDLAKGLGNDVGSEMLAAGKAAQAVGSQIALIDVNAQELVSRLWEEMPFFERLRILGSSVLARFPWRRGRTVEEEVAKYQADPALYLAELGKAYPTLKRVLIDDRNAHMAKELRKLLEKHERVVAVVGDGHVDGLVALLGDVKPRVVRLAQLRSMRPRQIQWSFGQNRDRVAFSFDQQSLEESLTWAPLFR